MVHDSSPWTGALRGELIAILAEAAELAAQLDAPASERLVASVERPLTNALGRTAPAGDGVSGTAGPRDGGPPLERLWRMA